MNLSFSNLNLNFQIIPLYGLAIGLLYYDPNLEPEIEPVDTDDFYSQITVMALFFGFHITVWRS
jgi:hypothetical protein